MRNCTLQLQEDNISATEAILLFISW